MIAERTPHTVPVSISYYSESEKDTLCNSVSDIFSYPDRITCDKIENILPPMQEEM